jgi:hypothetical protein
MTMIYQGHIEKGVVVFNEPVSLPDGTAIRVEAVPTVLANFWQSLSLDDLAVEQGVLVPRSDAEYLGGWPVDELEDGFEDAVVKWREGELEEIR